MNANADPHSSSVRLCPSLCVFCARSISRPVRERLDRGRCIAHVLAIFEHACDLLTPDGDVLALVTPQVGDGPLNIVMDGTAGLFAGVAPGAPVTLEPKRLMGSGLDVDLKQAAVWEPRPDWNRLRGRRAEILACLPLLRALCLHQAPPESLLALLKPTRSRDGLNETIFSAAQKAAAALRDGWRGDLLQLQEGVAGLAGLGGGLTAAGDDFLVGAMLWAWLAHPAPNLFCRTLTEVAVPSTTTLSVAFLGAAARGECSAPWHGLLAALSEGVEIKITAAVQEVLAHGATSGADALAGFLHLALGSEQG
ncbi:MAG: DUF2877 domain-containing protein [Anaerolineae bacterium]|nr:MAG: DUF2877 domain-containing protein [Anaerolineae bacterium]